MSIPCLIHERNETPENRQQIQLARRAEEDPGIVSKMKESRWLFSRFCPRIDFIVEHSCLGDYFTKPPLKRWFSARFIYTRVYTYICIRTCVRSGIDGDNSGTTGGGGGGGGKKGPDAARTKDQKGEDPRRRAQRTRTRCKEIASPAKSRTPMQPPNQSSIRAIDSLRFQPADYLISDASPRPPSQSSLSSFAEPTNTRRYTRRETENEQGMLD